MNWKKEIIKTINSISGKYSAYEVFSDWVKCSSLAISNSCELMRNKLWQERERTYMETIRKYNPDEQLKLSDMFFMLSEALEEEMTDVLGQIYMESGMGSKVAGQFFTPYHLSEMCARLAITEIKDGEVLKLNEPSCGGGGMIIAAAAALKGRGINYQRRMDVVAQDLDWKGVYMCYLQLSLLGIKAIVVQGDTLSEPYDLKKTDRSRMLITPAKLGVLL